MPSGFAAEEAGWGRRKLGHGRLGGIGEAFGIDKRFFVGNTGEEEGRWAMDKDTIIQYLGELKDELLGMGIAGEV